MKRMRRSSETLKTFIYFGEPYHEYQRGRFESLGKLHFEVKATSLAQAKIRILYKIKQYVNAINPQYGYPKGDPRIGRYIIINIKGSDIDEIVDEVRLPEVKSASLDDVKSKEPEQLSLDLEVENRPNYRRPE